MSKSLVEDDFFIDRGRLPKLYKDVEVGDYFGLSRIIEKEIGEGTKHNPKQIVTWSEKAAWDRQYKACAHILIAGNCTTSKHLPTHRLLDLTFSSARALVESGDHGVSRFVRILCRRLSHTSSKNEIVEKMIDTLAKSMCLITSLEAVDGSGNSFWTDTLLEEIQNLLSKKYNQRFKSAYSLKLWKNCEKLMDAVQKSEAP